MKKSPWNFLTRLTSRRRAEPSDGDPSASNPELLAIEAEEGLQTDAVTSDQHADSPTEMDGSGAEQISSDLSLPETETGAQESERDLSPADIQSEAPNVAVETNDADAKPLSDKAPGPSVDTSSETSEISATAGRASQPMTSPSATAGKVAAKRKVTKPSAKETADVKRAPEGFDAVAKSSVSSEIIDLDDEIQRLRVQLAEKLILQNAQLQKMLERFDPKKL
jgi:hypothetical protein